MQDNHKDSAVRAAINAPITPNLQSYGTYVSEAMFKQYPDVVWHVLVSNFAGCDLETDSFCG